LDQFTAERIADPRLTEFAAERIVVVEDESVPAAGAAIEVDLVGGDRVSVRRDVPKGDADDPLSRDEVVSKFRRSAEGVLAPAAVDAALAGLIDIEAVPNVDALLADLRAPDYALSEAKATFRI
jgi:2-methylcitrate dehydratase PrpD